MLPTIVACLLLAGCSAPEPPQPSPKPAAPSPDDASIPCTHDISGGRATPGEGYRLVLDAVALPAGTLEPHPTDDPNRYFAKHGLVVRANTAVEVRLAPEAALGVSIGWGSPGPEGTSVRVPACPGTNGWLAFAGGYTVPKPMCVPLVIRVAGREDEARVSVGVPC
ncbi:hypothetical protein AB0F81_16435 [Actinoplanes sp. NPDC024001]|uniref:hypothetical protein n=1 Tax=Actinoplanes sp. NPDC024001 TaxID=3154598 RepID=UPI0033D2AD64